LYGVFPSTVPLCPLYAKSRRNQIQRKRKVNRAGSLCKEDHSTLCRFPGRVFGNKGVYPCSEVSKHQGRSRYPRQGDSGRHRCLPARVIQQAKTARYSPVRERTPEALAEEAAA